MAQTLSTDEIIFYTTGNGSTKRDKYKKTPDKKKGGPTSMTQALKGAIYEVLRAFFPFTSMNLLGLQRSKLLLVATLVKTMLSITSLP